MLSMAQTQLPGGGVCSWSVPGSQGFLGPWPLPRGSRNRPAAQYFVTILSPWDCFGETAFGYDCLFCCAVVFLHTFLSSKARKCLPCRPPGKVLAQGHRLGRSCSSFPGGPQELGPGNGLAFLAQEFLSFTSTLSCSACPWPPSFLSLVSDDSVIAVSFQSFLEVGKMCR